MIVTTAQTLRAKFEIELQALQEQCTHDDAEWMESQYAPGHTDGAVKVCLLCEKVLERK